MPLSQTFEDGTDPCLSTAGLCLAGHSTQHKPVGHADGVELPETYELGYEEAEARFVALLDNSDAETEDDEP